MGFHSYLRYRSLQLEFAGNIIPVGFHSNRDAAVLTDKDVTASRSRLNMAWVLLGRGRRDATMKLQ